MSKEEGDSVITLPDEEKTNDDLIIDEWLESLGEQPSTIVTQRNRRIQKVPQTLRMNKHNKKEYDPVVVSFGPYNHGKKDLQLAEEFKQTSLRIYASYCHGKSIGDVRNKVLEVIDVARGCYLEGSTNDYNDEEFAEMMLLDGCLLLNFIEWFSTMDMKLMLIVDQLGAFGYNNLCRDMFLLENQLPYQVLQMLMSIRFDKEDQMNKILDFLLESFDTYFLYEPQRPWDEKWKATITRQYEKQPPLHLLEILRSYFVSKFRVVKSIRNPLISVDGKVNLKKYIHSFRSVTEIKAKGILFRPCISSSGKSETGINFKSHYLYGKLEIPPIRIAPNTKTYLLNLIAYEMCPNNPNDFKVMAYVQFMKKLIQYPDDVKELRTKNILYNFMGGDDEVVTMFKDIVALFDHPMDFAAVEDQIQRHYDNKARTWFAELVAKYFSSPWTAIAFLGAVALLVLAILQTHFTIHPPKK